MYPTDVIISTDYPGVVDDATETGALHFEDREVDGVMYRATNATFDKTGITGPHWTRVTSGQDAYAIVQNSDGSLGFLQAPDTLTWTPDGWLGGGQRGVFNVYDFGAVGDGVNPDASAIQAADVLLCQLEVPIETTAEALHQAVEELLTHAELRREMADAARKLAGADAAKRVAEEIEASCNRN